MLNFNRHLSHLTSFGKTDTLNNQYVLREEFLSKFLLLLCLRFPFQLFISVLVNLLI